MQVFSAPGLQTTTLLEELQGVQLRKVSLYTIISLYESYACMFCVSLSICDQLPQTVITNVSYYRYVQVSRVDDTKRSPGQEILFYVIAHAMSKRRHLLEPSSDDEDDHDSEWED